MDAADTRRTVTCMRRRRLTGDLDGEVEPRLSHLAPARACVLARVVAMRRVDAQLATVVRQRVPAATAFLTTVYITVT